MTHLILPIARVKIYHYLICGAIAFLVISCMPANHVTESSRSPAITVADSFATTSDYLAAARRQLDAGRYDDSLKLSQNVLEREPNNQAAHVISGVCWVKLGNSENARRAFETALTIARNTDDAASAEFWLNKLKHPLAVMVIPFQETSQDGYYRTRSSQALHEALRRALFESGLYSFSNAEREGWSSRARGATNQQHCEAAKRNGAKIALIGLAESSVVEDVPIIYDRRNRYYTARIKVTLQLYGVADCHLIRTLTETETIKQLPGRDTSVQRAVTSVTRKLAARIHETLY